MPGQISILILEDIPEDAVLLERALSSYGISFVSILAQSRDAFIEALDAGTPDLILADYRLPGFSGLDALRMAKEKHPDTPFILVAGSIMEDLTTRILREGANDYVRKESLIRLGPAALNAVRSARKNQKLILANRALAESEARYRLLFESANDVMVQIDRFGLIVDINEPALRNYGYASSEFLGRDISLLGSFFSPASVTRMREKFTRRMLGKTVRPYEVSARTKDGKKIYFQVNGERLEDSEGGLLGEFAVLHDITEHKRLVEMLRSMSMQDDLTALHNRRGFLVLAEQQLKLARRSRRGALLFYMDFDGMKWINDTIGHVAGDRALQGVASVLKSTFRESYIIARIGGDEFVALAVEMPEKDGPDGSSVIARLSENLDVYDAASSEPFNFSLSIGQTRFDPAGSATIEDLLALADADMYREKKERKKAGSRKA